MWVKGRKKVAGFLLYMWTMESKMNENQLEGRQGSR